MKNVFLILTIFIFYSCSSQNKDIDYNLDFEIESKDKSIPEGWFLWGNKNVKLDSTTYKSGKKSISIFEYGIGELGIIANKIKNNYRGKEITLEGYIKTEKLEDGFAGLLIRINEGENVLEFDNMKSQNISGTQDWKKYAVKVPLHNKADYIYIGAILQGNGKAWFDNLKVFVDGVEIGKDSIISRHINEQDSVKFSIKDLSKVQIDNLYKLGKKWSYLKYNSSVIAEGKIDWDEELFKFLHNIYNNNFDKVLNTWSTSFDKKGNIEENVYVDFYPEEGNPIFKNELSYPNMRWDDDGLKILALFRYWSIIEYFYPYKHLFTKNWEDILYEFIPKFINSKDELSYKLSVLELTSEINDSHATIFDLGDTIEKFYGINKAPIEAKFVGNRLVITETNSQLHIYAGDVITEIDNKRIEDIIKEKSKYEQASNQNGLLRNISFKIFRTNNNFLSLKIKRNKLGFELKVNVKCIPIGSTQYNKELPSHKLLSEEVGYINPGFLKENEIDLIMNEYINKKGIIIDLRYYPSDFIVSSLSKYLVSSPTDFAKITRTSFENIGKFTTGNPLQVGENYKKQFKGKVAILVNEMTQSNAEFTAMALSVAPRSTVIGSQTAGTDGNVSKIILPGNISTTITGIGVLYPNGKETQRNGILIDIPVKITIKGIRSGKDEILQKAINFIVQ